MMRDSVAVHRSIERWEAAGLLDAATAAGLRAELTAQSERARLRFSRLLLAATAAVVLVIAAGTFTAWIWPALGVGTRCLLIAGLGLLLLVAGARLERGPRREPGWLLQASGLVLIALACGYSGEQWANGSTVGVITGLASLLTGVLTFRYFVRSSAVMPAVSVLLGYVFAFVFLVRAFAEGSGDTLVWALDGLFVIEALLLFRALSTRRAPRWAAGAAGVLLYFMPVLIAATVVGPLHGGGSDTAWPLDAWLAGVTALLLWLRARAPGPRWGDLASLGIGVSVLIAVPLAFHTTLNAAGGPPEAAALAVAAVGGLALAFAIPRGERDILIAGALALVVAAWYYAAERGEALSAFLALGFTAGVLFWVATRIGHGRREPSA